MATTITERPHLYSFSQNEIRYILHVTDPAAIGCAVDVEVYYHDVSETDGILFKAFTLYPPSDGNIYCQLDDYLDSLLSPELPSILGDIIQPVTSQIKYFYIRYRQITDAAPFPDWITDEANKRIALSGGVEQMKFDRNNFFVSYLSAAKPFLTWQPSGRFVFSDERHYLTFLLTESVTFEVDIHTVFTDGTINDITIPFNAGNNLLFRIKSGAKDLGLDKIDATKQLYYYEIKVVRQVDKTMLVNAYRYFLEYRPLYSNVVKISDLIFFNSISGIDTVRVKGETTWSIDNSADDVEHITGNNAVNTDRPAAQFSQANLLKKDNYKGDAGWSRTPAQQEALIELLLSKGIYEIVDGRWIRVVNIRKGLDLRVSTDKKWSFPVEWSYGYADKVFTPKSVLLGLGVPYIEPVPPPPPCIGVGIPGGISLPDGVVGQIYSYSFGITGTAPFTMSDIAKPDWMNIAMNGNTISFTGTPDAAVSGLNVSFFIHNCSSSSSSFADTINISAAVVISPPTGHSVVFINQSGTSIQITADGHPYPAGGPVSSGSFNAMLSSGVIKISTGTGPYTLRCVTSVNDNPAQITLNNVAVNQNITIDLTVTNYIWIALY